MKKNTITFDELSRILTNRVNKIIDEQEAKAAKRAEELANEQAALLRQAEIDVKMDVIKELDK